MVNTHKGTAVITGGATRIGRELSLTLAACGYEVGIHYRSSGLTAQELEKQITENDGKAFLLQADLLRRDEVSTLLETAKEASGPVSLLVNSASLFEDDAIETFTDSTWDDHMDIHLYAPMKLAQNFAKQISSEFDNQIINIIDQRVWALTPKFFSYTLSKSALWTATQTLAQALGPKNIRVNAIGPGPTLRNKRQTEEDWQKQNEATILRRGASPADIAHALRYLIEASAVTGQMIAVDGGQHLAWETADVMVSE